MRKNILAIVLTLGVGLLGSMVTRPGIESWYQGLNKSPLNPPNWVFGPVWTVLYVLMGLALGWVWNQKTKLVKLKAYLLFFIQLGLNFLWSLVFFGYHSPTLALGVIIVLGLVILLTIIEFRKISRVAAYMLIPYLAWVTFAAYLNWEVVRRN
jgi:tryptophan-rich sensory protein